MTIAGSVAWAQVTELPEGKGKPIIARSCTACHGLDYVVAARLPKEQWRELVAEMRARGADLTEEEVPVVLDYLAEHFGPKTDERAARVVVVHGE